ncbi:MAG TPA: OmpA family protein [Candidatus Dormibacteraeota bacterium]|jgi:OOP family OmpA-OmpF porin|nr:OmpA family protein [Candidatus Dormibacteraeota bacterium]
MKITIATAVLGSFLLAAGCATKHYVAQQVDPVNAKVGEVDKNQQNTQKTLEDDERKLSATDEKATGADARATDAIGRADAASKKADQVKSDLRNELNDRIANLDDYKSSGEATVLFKFNSAKLTDDGKQQLDQLVSGPASSAKRYFVAIQGFTDKTGSADYNLDLSRRRAQAVQTYLVAQRNVPVYRIQIVGLGKDKPINDQKTRDDRSKNRRVEVTLFSADSSAATSAQSSGSSK